LIKTFSFTAALRCLDYATVYHYNEFERKTEASSFKDAGREQDNPEKDILIALLRGSIYRA